MTKIVLLNNQVCNILSEQQFAEVDPIFTTGQYKTVVDIENDVLVNLHDFYDPNTKTFSSYNINRYTTLRKELIDEISTKALNAPIDHNGRLWDANSIAQERLVATLSVAGANGNKLPADFKWRDYSNSNVSVTFEELVALSDAILTRNFQIYQTTWELKDTPFNPESEDDWNKELDRLQDLLLQQ